MMMGQGEGWEAGFNDGGDGLICHPFNFSYKEAARQKKNKKIKNTKKFKGVKRDMQGPQ